LLSTGSVFFVLVEVGENRATVRARSAGEDDDPSPRRSGIEANFDHPAGAVVPEVCTFVPAPSRTTRAAVLWIDHPDFDHCEQPLRVPAGARWSWVRERGGRPAAAAPACPARGRDVPATAAAAPCDAWARPLEAGGRGCFVCPLLGVTAVFAGGMPARLRLSQKSITAGI